MPKFMTIGYGMLGRVRSWVLIFPLGEDGKIIEHWDVLQIIPPRQRTPTTCCEPPSQHRPEPAIALLVMAVFGPSAFRWKAQKADGRSQYLTIWLH